MKTSAKYFGIAVEA